VPARVPGFEPWRRRRPAGRRTNSTAQRERHHVLVHLDLGDWPSSDDALIEVQRRLAHEADSVVLAAPWSPTRSSSIGGCFVAFARGEAGPGKPGDRAWAAAVVWRRDESSRDHRRPTDRHLRGIPGRDLPRRADDVIAQAVAAHHVAAAYVPGLLARREGPVLAAAVSALDVAPDLLLVDATGLDHPRRGGLAVHLGAVTGIPSVGVTQQPLVASGPLPELQRGAMMPVLLEGRCVGFWVCTRTGARPVVAHAGWRTTPEAAAQAVLAASTEAARTPIPLQEARRVAREARALAGAG
jgi:deoxyribonuclease V